MKKKVRFGICHKCGAVPIQEIDLIELSITERCQECGSVRIDREYIARYGIPAIFTTEEDYSL